MELERSVRVRSPRPGLEENGLSPAAVGSLGEGLREEVASSYLSVGNRL